MKKVTMNWAKAAKPPTEAITAKPITQKPHLIDIGVNLTSKQLKNNIPEILLKSFNADVKTVILTGTCLETSLKAIQLCKQFNRPNMPRLYCTVGVHPHSAQRNNSIDLHQKLLKLIKENRDVVVAVGEAGLDYNRNFSPHDIQKKVFEIQCELAVKVGLPLFLHEREAHEDFLAILTKYETKAVVHCFTGTRIEMLKYVNLGYYIGLTGFITDLKRASEQRLFVHEIPSNRLMIETDAPYMVPKNMPRVKVNEPAYLEYVAIDVAQLRHTPIEELKKELFDTTYEFFNLRAS
jgi:TatD DNase family protein